MSTKEKTMSIGISVALLVLAAAAARLSEGERPRAREFGLRIGVLEPGPLNAITDVAGVRIGHVTLVREAEIRTGITAILPHEGNLFQEKVPGAMAVANGFGKLTGFTQVEEMGTIETPIVLTNTLSVPTAADAILDYVLGLPGNEGVASVNPVVGETNDGWLNDIRGRHVTKTDVLKAIHEAKGGPVAEGAVGAGTGTVCFNFKGGIGTSSRRLPEARGGFTIGVLVQTNFGGNLTIAGRIVGPLLRQAQGLREEGEDGSCMIVVATDAPLDSRNLKRLARRALLGIPRTGGYYSNGSGDYAIAFSTAVEVRAPNRSSGRTRTLTVLRDEAVSSLFLAAAEAAEEAILNSLLRAERTEGRDGHVSEALPLDKLKEILK